MNTGRKVLCCAIAALAMTLSGCVAPKAQVAVSVPANTDISHARRLAVLPFDGPGAKELQSAVETALINARNGGQPYFTVVSREQLNRVLREQDLGTSVRFDERTAAAIGKLVGAEALVTGIVSAFDTSDRRFSQQWTVYSAGGDKDGRKVTASCLEREGRVVATIKIIEVESAMMIAAKPLTAVGSSEDCAERRSGLKITDKNVMLNGLSHQVAAGLMAEVTPRRLYQAMELRDEDDGGGGKEVSERLKRGILYAENGSWEMAREEWEDAVRLNPNSAAAHYNLGVAHEAHGKLEKARNSYRTAARLQPDELYIRASMAIEERLRDADRFYRQTSVGDYAQ